MNFTPVIIIGAPRSGTNMLRDVLARLPGCVTWPCDEINYLWRHGNARYPSDVFPPELATPQVAAYIRGHFAKLARGSGATAVIEKTCANSLRVGFVDRVFPEAKYLFIVRHGLDAAVSASHRWKAPLDPRYLLKKTRYVPITDLPYYGWRYFCNRLQRLVSPERRLAFWGPALHDMQGVLRQRSLLEVCALQWQACVEQAERDLGALPPEKVFRLTYEEFVAAPRERLAAICAFLQSPGIGPDDLARAVAGVTVASVGKGVTRLAASERRTVSALIGTTLDRYYPHG